MASVSEDNIVMVWQPAMRIWAGEKVKVDESELEGEPMEGIETLDGPAEASTNKKTGNGKRAGEGNGTASGSKEGETAEKVS